MKKGAKLKYVVKMKFRTYLKESIRRYRSGKKGVSILLLASSLLMGAACVSRPLSQTNLESSYEKLFLTEDRFVPEFLSQNPNHDETYIAVVGAEAGRVLLDLKEILPKGATKEKKHQAVESLMRKYGITAFFVDVPGRPNVIDPGWCISYERAWALGHDSGYRTSKLMRYLESDR